MKSIAGLLIGKIGCRIVSVGLRLINIGKKMLGEELPKYVPMENEVKFSIN